MEDRGQTEREHTEHTLTVEKKPVLIERVQTLEFEMRERDSRILQLSQRLEDVERHVERLAREVGTDDIRVAVR